MRNTKQVKAPILIHLNCLERHLVRLEKVPLIKLLQRTKTKSPKRHRKISKFRLKTNQSVTKEWFGPWFFAMAVNSLCRCTEICPVFIVVATPSTSSDKSQVAGRQTQISVRTLWRVSAHKCVERTKKSCKSILTLLWKKLANFLNYVKWSTCTPLAWTGLCLWRKLGLWQSIVIKWRQFNSRTKRQISQRQLSLRKGSLKSNLSFILMLDHITILI